MKTNNFSGVIGRLNEAMEELLASWQETKVQWNDHNSHQFEENYLIPLYNATRQTVESTRMMNETTRKAVQECTRGPFESS
ncbi:hypothetical protein Pla110_32270 [Polystyrenella longa]|uniref:Uncharacterized protein n=1 Tax=Polystyrenella longa TaxID=2528007 RepID=A0A518CQJ6_9PLAN|nr:hypothetical protein [Polystyrenella longa]QDU81485.1 hypothetical protein Pla110_32270 [Polystyrenella longa]